MQGESSTLSLHALPQCPEWSVDAIGGDVEEAIEWFRTHKHPDLLFLDIHLTDGSAFDFLSAAKPQSAIIFTTAYDQYAIRAFSNPSTRAGYARR